MCSTPSTRYDQATSPVPVAPFTVNCGSVRQHAIDLAGAVQALDAHDDIRDAAGDSFDARASDRQARRRARPASVRCRRCRLNTPCGWCELRRALGKADAAPRGASRPSRALSTSRRSDPPRRRSAPFRAAPDRQAGRRPHARPDEKHSSSARSAQRIGVQALARIIRRLAAAPAPSMRTAYFARNLS